MTKGPILSFNVRSALPDKKFQTQVSELLQSPSFESLLQRARQPEGMSSVWWGLR